MELCVISDNTAREPVLVEVLQLSAAVTRLKRFYKEGLGTMIATRPATACIFVAENRLIKL